MVCFRWAVVEVEASRLKERRESIPPLEEDTHNFNHSAVTADEEGR